MMDARDLALQASCPVVSAPRFSDLVALDHNGERLVLASNGIFLEICRPWARSITQVGPALSMTVPFGNVKEVFEYKAGQLPRPLLEEFVAWASQEHHVEIGAVITWNESTGEYALLRTKTNHATSGSLNYELPALAPGVHVVVDCHSHSFNAAYFSRIDDTDDQHSFKISFVVGNCDTAKPSTVARLCLRGKFKQLSWKI
jgi:PRTRC genetic system protein A